MTWTVSSRVNLKKMLGIVAVVFVLFWIISAPTSASGSMNRMMSNLNDAGTSMTTFMGNLLGGGSSGSSGYTRRHDDDRTDIYRR